MRRRLLDRGRALLQPTVPRKLYKEQDFQTPQSVTQRPINEVWVGDREQRD